MNEAFTHAEIEARNCRLLALKAEAWDSIMPQLERYRALASRMHAPLGVSLFAWAADELERLERILIAAGAITPK